MAGLTVAQLRQFAEQGYLIVEDVLDPARNFAPAMAEYAGVLDGIANELYTEGVVPSTYAELPFKDRLLALRAASGREFGQYFDFSLPQAGVRPDTPIHAGPAVFRVLTHPAILDIVESVIGPEIFSCPVQHTRIKMPLHTLKDGAGSLVAKTPWHQDNGVLMPEADVATILTVWMPLNNATVANGCLQVVPRSHGGGLVAHCPRPEGLAIPDQFIDQQQAIPLPMRAGSILLLTQRTMHGSLDNTTEHDVRISFDLRYQPLGQPTGRPAFAEAGFVARSAAHPEQELRDPATWEENWLRGRAQLAAENDPAFNRWRADAPVCA
jgi:phytanoyl-CoA hydroxylase